MKTLLSGADISNENLAQKPGISYLLALVLNQEHPFFFFLIIIISKYLL